MGTKALTAIVALGVLGFFVGSVMENEMVYTLSGCVAAWAGLVLAILRGRAETNEEA